MIVLSSPLKFSTMLLAEIKSPLWATMYVLDLRSKKQNIFLPLGAGGYPVWPWATVLSKVFWVFTRRVHVF